MPRLKAKQEEDESIDLKAELSAYLKVREESKADEEAQKEVGKVIGGTKGNKVLEFVSGSPNKAYVKEDAPNVFDYDELTKYGFGNLVTPIMNAGGRLQMYDLMGMTPPPMPDRLKPKKVRRIIIDRTGEDDTARYTGLKMGQVLDDDEMGRALAEAQRKKKEGLELKKKLKEQEYVQPFADKRNTGPRMTPDWTPEQLDEEGKRQGKAQAWARKARAGELKKDPYEDLAIEGGSRIYSIVTTLFVSFALGNASNMAAAFLLGSDEAGSALLSQLRFPAYALILFSIISSVVSAGVLAPSKKRNTFVWAMKGYIGGPLAALELNGLGELKERGYEN